MKDNVKLALVQTDTRDDVEKNKSTAAHFVKEAASAGARLVIFPEHADAIGRHARRFAEYVPGPLSEFYSKLAKEYGVYIHCGSLTEKNDTDRPYNTSLVFDNCGKQIALYRKLHMFDVQISDGPSIIESKNVMKGDRISVLKTDMCTIGLSICYDIRFAEMYRIMARLGAELFVISASFTENTGKAHWETLVRARAIENGCFVAAVGQCGKKHGYTAWGHTMFVSPWGEILAELDREEGMLLVDMDVSMVEKAREQIPSLKNTRDDIYRLDCEEMYVYEG